MRTTLFTSLTVLLVGCASGPYAYLDDQHRGAKADPNLFPLSITAVDGRMHGIKPVKVEPGVHTVVAVSLRPTGSRRAIQEQAFLFEAKACLRYVIGARHRDRLSESWEPEVVDYRPIPGCEAGEVEITTD